MDTFELQVTQELACGGNLDAMNALIEHYLNQNDYHSAFMIASRFQYFSYPDGYKTLGNFYFKGLGVEKDIEKAKSYYLKGFAMGNSDCGYNLALLYFKETDYLNALSYLTQLVDNNHVASIKLLATMYVSGLGVMKDMNIAINLLLRAYELGDTKVADKLAKIYYQAKEYNKAFHYFSIGASYKDLDSIYHLGLCYQNGLGTKQDFYQAKIYYEMGANMNEPRCLYNLATFYRDGLGGNSNPLLAEKLFEQASEHGLKKPEKN